jgi:hypothetical protein
MPSGSVKVMPGYTRVTFTCGGIITPLELELLLEEEELELEELEELLVTPLEEELELEELEELLVTPLDEEELELEELEELLLDEDELLLELDELEDVPPPQPIAEPDTTISSIHTSALWLLKLCQPNIT